MRLLAIFLVPLVFSSFSFASTLICTGSGLSLSEIYPDGGPHISATIQLVLNGNFLVNEGLGKPGTRLASYSLNDSAVALTKPLKKGDFIISYFKQSLAVHSTNQTNPAMLFLDEVVCRSERYVGIPRP